MHIWRGREATIEADQRATDALVEHAERQREQALRVWHPHRQVAFGRRDANTEGYELAREVADDRGFPATSRDVGGRAVVFTGTTVAFVHAIPVDSARGGIEQRYDDATATLQHALSDLGVETTPGEPANSFCPGTHSLQTDGKLAGLAQRVTGDVAVVAGVVLVSDMDLFSAITQAVYDRLEVPFDPKSVRTVETGGGPADPEPVEAALLEAFGARVER